MTLDELIARGLISPGAAARVGLDIGDDSVASPTPDQQAMTHYDVDPAAEEVGRRVRQTGQNLWNTVTAPYRTAEDLGRQMRQGTLDVTDPQTAGKGLNLAWYAVTGQMPFATEGAAGAFGGRLPAGTYTRMSTRYPTGKAATEDALRDQLGIDTEAMQQDPEFFSKVIDRIKQYPNLTAAEKRGSDARVAENFKNHMADNLRFMYDVVPNVIRDRGPNWYVGGNRIASERAADVGIPVQSSVGTYAAQSPQKDWYMNATLGDRVLDIVHNRGSQKFTSKMLDKAQELYGDDPDLIARISGPGTLNARLQSLSDKLRNGTATRPDLQDAGAWVRTFDETYHDPRYAVLSPEGDYLNFPTTKAGRDRLRTWGSNLEAGRGVASAISRGDPNIIRPLLGEAHKVPSFSNNLGDPFHPAGDFTGDTHAIATSLLRPLAAQHQHVAEGFSGPPKSINYGLRGWYGLMADAHRDVAAELGLLPRELQSVTWEGGRGLFPRAFKTDKNLNAINQMWADRGNAPIRAVQNRIYDYAGGIAEPEWATMSQRPGLRWDFFR